MEQTTRKHHFFLKLIGLIVAGWILVIGFAFFWPTPDLWFFGTREAIRHTLSQDSSNEERLRHIILANRQYEMGREGGVVIGYGTTSWQQIRKELTPIDLPNLLQLYKYTPIDKDDKLRIGILWGIATQCQDGLSLIEQAYKDHNFDLGDAGDALSHIMVLAQPNNAICPPELYNAAQETQNRLYDAWEASQTIKAQTKQEEIK